MQAKFSQLTLEDSNVHELNREKIFKAFKKACELNDLTTAITLIDQYPLLSDFSNDNMLYWALCHNRLSIFEKLLNNAAIQNFPANQKTLDNLFSILQINIINNFVAYFKLLYPFWQKQLSPENEQQERKRLENLISEQFIQYLLTGEDSNLPDLTKEEICNAFQEACKSHNLMKAFCLIDRYPVLSDFSGNIIQNSLYKAISLNRLSIFEKLLSKAAIQNFPVNQETLDNLFTILKINIKNSHGEYFKLIYPYWQKQLSPENEQQERKKLADFIQENSEGYNQLLKSVGNTLGNHGRSLLLAKQGLFSPNGQEYLPPELAKHIVNLAIQSEPAFK